MDDTFAELPHCFQVDLDLVFIKKSQVRRTWLLLFCGKIYLFADNGKRRYLLGKLHIKLHFRLSGLYQCVAFQIAHLLRNQ